MQKIHLVRKWWEKLKKAIKKWTWQDKEETEEEFLERQW
jgi:hypothetical protein